MRHFFTALLSLSMATFALADNRPADDCQISIKRIAASIGSHGSSSMNVVVKVGWLGNDEHIQKVRFWGKTSAIDLGNGKDCYMGKPQANWREIQHANIPHSYGNTLGYGEYLFQFPIYTGTVIGACPGFKFSTEGAFFVETNKNTYWLNPQLDRNQHYVFDSNAQRIIKEKARNSWFYYYDVSKEAYYNPILPKQCE